jgi:hypothetical protein
MQSSKWTILCYAYPQLPVCPRRLSFGGDYLYLNGNPFTILSCEFLSSYWGRVTRPQLRYDWKASRSWCSTFSFEGFDDTFKMCKERLQTMERALVQRGYTCTSARTYWVLRLAWNLNGKRPLACEGFPGGHLRFATWALSSGPLTLICYVGTKTQTLKMLDCRGILWPRSQPRK